MFQFTTLPPLSLYIHFPWCVQKCPYCDFNSHAVKDALHEKTYIDALITDLEQELPLIWGRTISSIFMGGGTPSLFSPESIERLLSELRARLNFSPDIEISMEANPGTVEQGRFAEYRAAGINRLSIGIQSFSDDSLQRIGRIHGRKEAIRAAEQAHHSGFHSFNLDLMYGLPQQSLAEAIEDINTAIALEPQHISHYQLTIEPNTLFYHQTPTVADDDQLWEMQQACQKQLAQADYQHYEISAYARPGHRCQHNLNYWQFGDYLGIGAGAHGKISDAARQNIVRRSKKRHPQDYLENVATDERISSEKPISPQDAAFEFMMNVLRLSEGFNTTLFTDHTGLAISHITPALKQAEENGWIEWERHHIRPTETGQQYLNDLLQLFLPY